VSEAALPPPIPPAALVLQDAPGAKAAKTCGILSIVFAITCVGFPLAAILGIVALMKQASAKRLAREAPGTYRTPPSGAMAMALVGLVLAGLSIPTLGIGAAVAIPAFVTYRDKARATVLRQNLQTVLTRAEQLLLENGNQSAEQLAQALLGDPALASLQNPFAPKAVALEVAQIPTRNGTLALWPAMEEGSDGMVQTKLLLVANYTEHGEMQQLAEELPIASLPAPEAPVPEEFPALPLLEEVPQETPVP